MRFNPCSSGWCLPAQVNILISWRHQRSFNPCSSGWCLPAMLYGDSGRPRYLVSILVLLDDAYRHGGGISPNTERICFNPCSSGWCLPAIMPAGRLTSGCRVSILVLLDDAYRPVTVWHFKSPFLCFNPCSSGWCLPARYLGSCSVLWWRVSILVLLDDAYRLYMDQVEELRFISFQSLFFWMMPTGYPHLVLSASILRSFNPCSSGWCLPANYLGAYSTEFKMFQSLFFWMMPTGMMFLLRL